MNDRTKHTRHLYIADNGGVYRRGSGVLPSPLTLQQMVHAHNDTVDKLRHYKLLAEDLEQRLEAAPGHTVATLMAAIDRLQSEAERDYQERQEAEEEIARLRKWIRSIQSTTNELLANALDGDEAPR